MNSSNSTSQSSSGESSAAPHQRYGHAQAAGMASQRGGGRYTVYLSGGCHTEKNYPLNDLWTLEVEGVPHAYHAASVAAANAKEEEEERKRQHDLHVLSELSSLSGSPLQPQTASRTVRFEDEDADQQQQRLITNTCFSGNKTTQLSRQQLGRDKTHMGSNSTSSSNDVKKWVHVEQAAAFQPPRYDHSFTIQQQTQRCLVFGGRSGNTPLNDVWIMEACVVPATWTKQITLNAPCRRYGHSATFLPARTDNLSRLVVFGGACDRGELGDCHVCDLEQQTWREVSTLRLPYPVSHGFLFYHESSARFYLMGGKVSGYSGRRRFETWALDGSKVSDAVLGLKIARRERRAVALPTQEEDGGEQDREDQLIQASQTNSAMESATENFNAHEENGNTDSNKLKKTNKKATSKAKRRKSSATPQSRALVTRKASTSASVTTVVTAPPANHSLLLVVSNECPWERLHAPNPDFGPSSELWMMGTVAIRDVILLLGGRRRPVHRSYPCETANGFSISLVNTSSSSSSSWRLGPWTQFDLPAVFGRRCDFSLIPWPKCDECDSNPKSEDSFFQLDLLVVGGFTPGMSLSAAVAASSEQNEDQLAEGNSDIRESRQGSEANNNDTRSNSGSSSVLSGGTPSKQHAKANDEGGFSVPLNPEVVHDVVQSCKAALETEKKRERRLREVGEEEAEGDETFDDETVHPFSPNHEAVLSKQHQGYNFATHVLRAPIVHPYSVRSLHRTVQRSSSKQQRTGEGVMQIERHGLAEEHEQLKQEDEEAAAAAGPEQGSADQHKRQQEQGKELFAGQFANIGPEVVDAVKEKSLASRFLVPWLRTARLNIFASSYAEHTSEGSAAAADEDKKHDDGEGDQKQQEEEEEEEEEGTTQHFAPHLLLLDDDEENEEDQKAADDGKDKEAATTDTADQNEREQEEVEHGKENETKEEEEEQVSEENRCWVCKVQGISHMLEPCGHYVCCVMCASGAVRCPRCDALVRSQSRGFDSKVYPFLHSFFKSHLRGQEEQEQERDGEKDGEGGMEMAVAAAAAASPRPATSFLLTETGRLLPADLVELRRPTPFLGPVVDPTPPSFRVATKATTTTATTALPASTTNHQEGGSDDDDDELQEQQRQQKIATAAAKKKQKEQIITATMCSVLGDCSSTESGGGIMINLAAVPRSSKTTAGQRNNGKWKPGHTQRCIDDPPVAADWKPSQSITGTALERRKGQQQQEARQRRHEYAEHDDDLARGIMKSFVEKARTVVGVDLDEKGRGAEAAAAGPVIVEEQPQQQQRRQGEGEEEGVDGDEHDGAEDSNSCCYDKLVTAEPSLMRMKRSYDAGYSLLGPAHAAHQPRVDMTAEQFEEEVGLLKRYLDEQHKKHEEATARPNTSIGQHDDDHDDEEKLVKRPTSSVGANNRKPPLALKGGLFQRPAVVPLGGSQRSLLHIDRHLSPMLLHQQQQQEKGKPKKKEKEKETQQQDEGEQEQKEHPTHHYVAAAVQTLRPSSVEQRRTRMACGVSPNMPDPPSLRCSRLADALVRKPISFDRKSVAVKNTSTM